MTSAPRPPLSTVLAGCTMVIAVDRRAGELAAALERHGAVVRHAPALTILPHIDDETLLARTRELMEHRPDIVVATTGVGFRGWMEAADEAGHLDELLAALRGARIVARGPKARGAIQQAGLTADWVAESETSAELGEYLLAQGVAGRRIAVQHHGSGADGLDDLFEGAGADVVSLTVYRWGPPPDPDAVTRSVTDTANGDIDAVLFTSAPGAAAWVGAAGSAGVLDGIRALVDAERVLAAAVGPITAEPLERAGLMPLVAERGRLGSLVRAVVGHYGAGRAPSRETAAGRLELRSSGAVLDGRFIPLSRTGADVVRTLFDANGAVLSRPAIQRALPRSGENPHAVEMAVARVRDALGAGVVKTVVKRGYRLDLAEPRVSPA
ncbi:uroporphyrinogen-III synthase [Microbacterium candidum]|uniref:Uroporphyrinogen-III synthase n=1 Tax=Microbacterium candidum TaxID=3041922 RepID=A0ABT7MZT5_9MICO|nr:uroporphyrinogen-III synthase [Microbacterium sp. ASV49]MDL9979974.1 uroporphyrinogen-III synthase [Microbacterium sp. ASV49]